MKVFLCEGIDRDGVVVRSLLRASGFGAAKTIFFQTHGIQATHITPKKP